MYPRNASTVHHTEYQPFILVYSANCKTSDLTRDNRQATTSSSLVVIGYPLAETGFEWFTREKNLILCLAKVDLESEKLFTEQ